MKKNFNLQPIKLVVLTGIVAAPIFAAPPPWQLGPVSGQLCASLDAILAGEIMNISTLAGFKNKEIDADKAMNLLMQTQQYIQQRHVDSARQAIAQVNMETGDRAFAAALLPQLLTVYQKCDLWISRFTMSKPENVSDADYATMENYCKVEPQNLHKNYCQPPDIKDCPAQGTKVGKTVWRKFKNKTGAELCSKVTEVDTIAAEYLIEPQLTPCDDAFNEAVETYIEDQVAKIADSCAKERERIEKERLEQERLEQERKKQEAEARLLIHDRYRDNQDGTVTDTTTKLMWKRCSEGQTWTGNTCAGKAITMTWDEAMPNAQQKSWASFAGRSDWRMPTIEELRQLVYCSNGTPAEEAWDNSCSGKNERNGTNYQRPTIDQTAFPNTPELFWSASPLAGGYAGGAWVVGFGSGDEYYDARTLTYRARLVCAGQ